MAISIAQYVDLLFKKLQGVAKTANSTVKGASNESIASPAFLRGDIVWVESNQIGNTAQAIAGISTAYRNGSAVECVADTTVPPIGGIRPTWLTNETYWIPQEFGATWLPKVFVGPSAAANIEATGTQIFSAGIGGVGEYYFDTQAGVLNFIGETIPTVLTAGNVVYVAGYQYSGLLGTTTLPGNTTIGNLVIANTTITTNQVNGNIILETTGNGLVLIDATTGLTVPSGNTDQRPASAGTGTVRFNTFTQNLEVYTGTSWVEVGSGGNTFTITNQTISPDGSSAVYTLDQDSTSSSILLTINGVNQTPDIDYSVAGNSLTMATTPLNSDLIQVRFLAGLVTNNTMTNSSGNAVITVADSGNIDLQPSTDHSVNSYGNILPAANVTYNLGSTTRRWKDLWLAGSTLTLGNIVIKNSSGNTISFYGPDGVTPATLDANAEIVADSISSGTSNVGIPVANGNVTTVANGNVTLTVTSTGANVTGTLNTTGNANVGNLGATNIVGTLTTAAQTNITSVGTLGSLSVAGNVTVGNVITTGSTGILSVNSIEHSGSNSVGNIGSASSYFDTVFATSTSAQYADLAEKYSSDDWYSPGTVLVFGGSAQVTACNQYADHRAAGVVSTAPAHLMNAELLGITATVALAGQVPCKVIGPVSKGDVLTTADVEGYAKTLDFSEFQPGCIIGKALEECGSGPTTILVAVVR